MACSWAPAGWLRRLGVGAAIDSASLPQVERAFADRMRNVKLVGSFTVDGREPRRQSPDGYEISSVEKVGDDLWRFNARLGSSGVGSICAARSSCPCAGSATRR